MLDLIVSELYQNFLSKKATCESNQSLSKWRWKRAINDQNFGASSGYGSDCCPPVVDPLTFIALLSFIAAATYFLQFTITMLLMMRRKRSLKSGKPEHAFDFIDLGIKIFLLISKLLFGSRS